MRAHVLASVAASVLLCIGTAAASEAGVTIDAGTRTEVIERLLNGLDGSYVFPEVARQMGEAVRERVRSGEYESFSGAQEFADKLTADLQAVSKDKHLVVKVTPPRPAGQVAPRDRAEQKRQMTEAMAQAARLDNAGFARAERLPGNVGYIDLVLLYPVAIAAEKAAAAMNQIADAESLIIDLRRNGGGDPETVALLVSYLLEPRRILVNTFVDREGKLKRETWTTPDLPAKRFVGKDVYLLTSSYTFSGAEEFAYDLKNLKRATIVGETTGGGANPFESFRINDRFEVGIPINRAVNPISKTNWEGVGVTPDVSVPRGLTR